MILVELRNRCYVHARDFKRQRFDPLLVDAMLNEAQEEFNAQTGLYTVRTQITIASGVGDLVEAGENANTIQGEIIRVEDSGNGNKFLARTTEEAMDVLKGAHWRGDVVGPLQYWMRGKPNEGTQSGFETITVYPLNASGTVNVFHVERPPDMLADTDTSVLPRHYHLALVWHAVKTLLADTNAQEDQAKIQSADARYQEYLSRAKEEAERHLRWR